MLVCSVSLRALRRAIAADLAEVVEAADATASGQVVFATLVDDPAAVNEIVDAYLGEIMLEAASAADAADANIPASYAGAVNEAATAASSQDATVVPLSANTWNPADSVNITLSNGNLSAANNNVSGGGTRATVGKSTGKYYWEVKVDVWAGANSWPGVIQSAVGLPGSLFTAGTSGVNSTGQIYVNTAGTSSLLGGRASGDTIGIAVDFGARLLWMRVAPAGSWNGSGTADPATGVGGLNINALTGTLFPVFNGFAVGDKATVNLGATAFSGVVPSGFNAGF
jgi:hypothetical protein